MQGMSDLRFRVVIGAYAQRYHLGRRDSVTETVQNWRDHLPKAIPLPHPSWRNTAWLRRNLWFETDLIPVLRQRVEEALS
jgi:uracil-DNA glycosylase